MKIFLCGQKSFGAAVLKRLIEDGHDIVGVSPAPQDRHYDKLKVAAIKAGAPLTVDGERLVSANIPSGTDLIVAAHSHWYITSQSVAKARYGGIGFHPSLLPRHRGRDAVRWTIAMHDAVGGCTVYWLNDKIDGGDIIRRAPIMIPSGWDYHDYWRHMFQIGVDMISDAARDIERGVAAHIPQEEECATWEPSFDVPRVPRRELIQLC